MQSYGTIRQGGYTMVILKKLFSFRPFVILAALLLVASSCSATLLLGIHSFTLYERKGVHDSFQTIAVPNCGSCDHNDAGEIESRYIKLDEAVDAASHSEFFDEKKHAQTLSATARTLGRQSTRKCMLQIFPPTRQRIRFIITAHIRVMLDYMKAFVLKMTCKSYP